MYCVKYELTFKVVEAAHVVVATPVLDCVSVGALDAGHVIKAFVAVIQIRLVANGLVSMMHSYLHF